MAAAVGKGVKAAAEVGKAVVAEVAEMVAEVGREVAEEAGAEGGSSHIPPWMHTRTAHSRTALPTKRVSAISATRSLGQSQGVTVGDRLAEGVDPHCYV